MAVLTLTLPPESAWDIAFLFHLSRFGSLLLAGTALSFLQRQGQGDSIAASQGFGWRAPLSVALLAYSLFSLLGTPLTFGFPAQWAVISTFGQQSNLWLSVLLVLALGISAYRVVRVLASLIQKNENERVQLESGWQRVLLTAMLIISFLLALFPRPLLSLALGISAAFSG
jgi:NADH:ubiquinone oxidoreductase subunit 2 (subunit N)